MLAIRLVKAVVGILALLIGVLMIFALAPHSIAMRATAISLGRTARFATFLPRRDNHCAIAAVWLALRNNQGPAKHRIRKASKVIGTDGNLSYVATPSGSFWIPAADIDTLAEELAEQELEVYGHDVRPGDVVLDCGANVGVYTRTALARNARIVVAIEPAPETLICLRRNFEREIQEGRVIAYPKGVWDKDTTLRLTTNVKLASTANSVAFNRGELGPEVPLTTIDELTAELKLPRVDFIKMDIEGSESHALMGAPNTLAKYKPRLAISMEHKQSDPGEIPPLVQRLNSQYQIEYANCGLTTGRVQPEMLFAW